MTYCVVSYCNAFRSTTFVVATDVEHFTNLNNFVIV